MKTKTKDFLARLAGFLSVRDNLNDVAATVLPEDLASTFEPVGLDTKPIQDESLLAGLVLGNDASIEECLDVLSEIAKHEIKPQLDQFGLALVEQIMGDETDSHFPKYKSAPIKSKSRSAEKIRNEYGGVALRILDLVRASIIVNTEHQLAQLLRKVMEDEDERSDFENVKVIRFKNRFQSPTFSGYRDALFNLKVTDPATGHAMIVELQVHLAQVMVHKPASHFYYGYFRQFFSGNMNVVSARMDLLTSLGAQVQSFQLDLMKQHAHSKETIDIESILRDLCVQDDDSSPNEIENGRLIEQMEENDAVKALIAELVPFWDFQDTLKSSAETYSFGNVETFEDIVEPVDSSTLTTEISLENLHGLAEEILPLFNQFGRALAQNVTQYDETGNFSWDDHHDDEPQDNDDEENIAEEVTSCFKFHIAPLKTNERSQSKASEKHEGNVSRLRDVVRGSIVVSDENRLESFFKYMMLIFENEIVKVVGFKNQFQEKPKDLYSAFLGYRHAVYSLLMESPEGGSMVVELKVHLEGHQTYEAQSLEYAEFFRSYLTGDESLVKDRLKLLDSFEAQVKNKEGREYAGRVETMIESFVERGDVDGLHTFETLLGPTMLSDMRVSILCSRERLRALEIKCTEKPSSLLEEEMLDAKVALGANLYESSRYGEELDGFEAMEVLQDAIEGFETMFETGKHSKVLRASIYYYATWFDMMPSEAPEATENSRKFKKVLEDCGEELGPDDETTIMCKNLYALVLSNFDSTESLKVLQEAYDDGVRSLGESHAVTLNCGCDLMFEYEYSDSKPDNLDRFAASVYKGYVVVFGRTPLALDAELTYANILRSTAHQKGELLGAEETQKLIDESKRLEMLHALGIATQYLDFSFDGSWYKSTPWSELPMDIKKAALKLSWEVKEEEGTSWYPAESRKWEDLSMEEIKAARVLGFNRHSWRDTFSGYLYLYSWSDLPAEKQESSLVLGWTEENWSNVAAEIRTWRELSPQEKKAASELNFSIRAWNLMFAAEDFETGGDDNGDY